MIDRGLRQPVGLTPRGRPDVQLRDELGLSSLQLSPEQLPKQVVVPVPLPVPVQRHQQHVRIFQRRQDPVRPVGGQDRVTQWPRHPVEHGRAGQERHQLW